MQRGEGNSTGNLISLSHICQFASGGVLPAVTLCRQETPHTFQADDITRLLPFWSYPALQADRLLINLLWTVWIIIGAFLEERDLFAEFGETYREYQRQVPMLIPWRRG